jgi:hypothetical protein
MAEVHNITNVLPGHNHPGDPSYIMYTEGCRHFDCLTEFTSYKFKLAQRKLTGDYVDLRRRENQLQTAVEQFAEQHRPVVKEPAQGEAVPAVSEPAALPVGTDNPRNDEIVTDDSGATEDPELSTDASRVLKYLTISRADARGRLNPKMTRMMSVVLQLDPDRCQAGLDELEEAGRLASDGTDLYLLAAEVG